MTGWDGDPGTDLSVLRGVQRRRRASGDRSEPDGGGDHPVRLTTEALRFDRPPPPRAYPQQVRVEAGDQDPAHARRRRPR